MAQKIKLEETQFVQNFQVKAAEMSWDLGDKEIKCLSEVLFAATADFLSQVKEKGKRTILSFETLKGTVIMGAVVEWKENDEGKGNWNYYFVFDREEYGVENVNVYTIHNNIIVTPFSTRAFDQMKMRFTSSSYISGLCLIFARSLVELLEANASEEGTTFELENFFEATAKIEDGEKVFTIEPSGSVKSIIKGNDEDAE